MVPSKTQETRDEAPREALATAAQAAAGQEANRVQTEIVIGPTLDGIPFAPLKSNAKIYVSAPIDSEATIVRLCSIPGFERVHALTVEDLADVDQAIAIYASSQKDAQQAATSGYEVSTLKRTVDELTRANHLMSAELAETRAERDELKRQHSGSEVARLQQQIEALRQQLDQGGGASVALEHENQQLRDEVARLRGEKAA